MSVPVPQAPECSACGSDLRNHHTLHGAPEVMFKNGSKIVEPVCRHCGRLISVEDIRGAIVPTSKVILISGTAGAGKSTIGQHIEREHGYVLIDGDATGYRLRQRARTGPAVKADEYLCHREVIRTMLVTLGLGYNVVVSYVIELADLARYERALAGLGVCYSIRFLTPSREACLARDKHRPCWTAGEEYVDKWFAGFQAMMATHSALCIDNSLETVEQTVARHFEPLLA